MSVKVYQKNEIMSVMSQGGLDPYPVFPQWNVMDIYPNQYWGLPYRLRTKRSYRMLYLENEYLRVAYNLEIGGRVWSIYDKIAKREAINHASGVWSYMGGFGKNYTCGGMEINYPIAHSPTTRLPREHRIIKNNDGSISIIIGEYERKWRTRWSVAYTLRPGKSYLEMTVRCYNRTALDTRHMFWANCGIPLNEHTEFIFPEKAGAVHGNEGVTFSWPKNIQKDQGFWANTPEPLGLYMLDASEPYFGYYDHSADFGLVHYADLSDLPGKKYWSWGSGWFGRQIAPHTHHPDVKPYGEIQAGRIVIQEHLDRIPPHSEQTWTEYWYPVRGVGRFHGAGKDAVIGIKKSETNKNIINVKVQGTGKYSNVNLDVYLNNGNKIRKIINISPERIVENTFNLEQNIKKYKIITAKITTSNGNVLGQAHLTQSVGRDSWTEVALKKEEHSKISAEDQFLKGEALARDWFRWNAYDEYEKTLKIDEGFCPAHIELAKIFINKGNYIAACDHLHKALMRNSDSLETKYFLGVASELRGNLSEAKQMLELACRYDYEARSRTYLAQIYIKENNFHKAIEYLLRVKALSSRLTVPRVLLAACLRNLGEKLKAKKEIIEVLEIDPMDPFVQIEAMLINGDLKGKKALLEQVDSYEPPILEAAFDYGKVGLYEEAYFTIKLLSNPGALSLFYRAWLEWQLGRKSISSKTLFKACEQNPIGQNAWRLEMIPILEWAMTLLPRNGRPYYHLGNLHMAKGNTEEAMKLWQKAENLGETCHILYGSFGTYWETVDNDIKKALKYYEKASSFDPNDIIMMTKIAEIFNKQSQFDKTIKYLLSKPQFLKRSCVMAYHLLQAYLSKKNYEQFDKFCKECDYRDNWQMRGPVTLWHQRYLQEGLELIASAKYKKALETLLRGSTKLPENLVPRVQRPDKNERILYHIGCCYEKLGQIEKAKEYWGKVITQKNITAWEPANCYLAWRYRYFQALAHQKLGSPELANIIFDGMETVSKKMFDIPYQARKDLMDLVVRGKFMSESKKDDPYIHPLDVGGRAEL